MYQQIRTAGGVVLFTSSSAMYNTISFAVLFINKYDTWLFKILETNAIRSWFAIIYSQRCRQNEWNSAFIENWFGSTVAVV